MAIGLACKPMTNWPIQVTPENVLLELEVLGDPIAHQRPRFNRKKERVYTPTASAQYKEKVAWSIRQACKISWDASETFGVQALFFRSNRQRIDLDNLLKSVMDAITQARLWVDDSQVREIIAHLSLGQANPRVVFMVYRVCDPSPNKPCEACGRPLPTGRGTKHKFCNEGCRRSAKRVNLLCEYCHETFEIPRCLAITPAWRERQPYRRRFCSRQCSIAAFSSLKRKKGKESDRWRCLTCAGRVSRKEYKQCRACSMKSREDPSSNYWRLRHKKSLGQLPLVLT